MRAIRAAALLGVLASPVSALPLGEPAPRYHWECVPFAREVSGVRIFGDAHTWWGQAEGRYARGDRPKRGAVMAFAPYGAMRLGHVATVSRIIDKRTVLVTHANWSPIDGRRGQVERDVEVRDVSEAGDWSAVRVWYAPNATLGTTAWPVHGFIYPGSAPGPAPLSYAKADYAKVETTPSKPPKPTGRLAYLSKVLRGLR